MRNPDSQTRPKPNADATRTPGTTGASVDASVVSGGGSDGWTRRTQTDVTSLLLELARALRGFCFYSETDAQRRSLLDRAYRALSGELKRAGVIDLDCSQAGFRARGVSGVVESDGVLGPLEQALEAHGLARLQLAPELTRDSLHAFLDLLGQPKDRFESPENFARALAARASKGISLNELDVQPPKETPKLSATPPRASASLGAMLISNDRDEPNGPETKTREKPSLETRPLEAPAADDRGERLRARLTELDCTIDDDEYAERADNIAIWARDLWNDELIDECYRALLVLADHAVGRGGRTEAQARTASDCFVHLAHGPRLIDLIRRAAAPGGGVRAAQLLLQLGPAAVPVIVDQICAEPDPDRWAPLHSLVLALGEASIPTLIEAIRGPNDKRARVGIRLAGELQNPAILPALLETLSSPSLSRRIDTIRALAYLPGDESRKALVEALDSNVEEMAMAATDAMATSVGNRAVPVLLDVLDASLRANRTNPSRRLIEVLGKLGDERAVPRLSAILERKAVLRRAHHHAIQLASVDALSILPTREARRSIERAALHAARPVRDRALRRLEEIETRESADS